MIVFCLLYSISIFCFFLLLFWESIFLKPLHMHTRGVYPTCKPRTGHLHLWLCLRVASQTAFSDVCALKSRKSNKALWCRTSLESWLCLCHSNVVAWYNLSSSIAVIKDLVMSFYVALSACRCWLTTSCRPCRSLPLPSFTEGTSRMAHRCAWCIRRGRYSVFWDTLWLLHTDQPIILL